MVDVSGIIARFLLGIGIDRVYGLCGGHIQPLWDQLVLAGIRIIDVRDEGAAVHMAQAQSELTDKMGVALVTAGPGMTNTITAIANAFVSRVPLLVLSAVPPRPQQYLNALQSIPQADLARPITRYSRTATQSRQVLPQLEEAVASAYGHFGEPGPAYIDFPTDLLREEISDPFPPWPSLSSSERSGPPNRAAFPAKRPSERPPSRRSGAMARNEGGSDLFFHPLPPMIPAPESVMAGADLIWTARRLVVITGRGARRSRKQLATFLEALGCVYLDTAESRGILPESHPAFMPAMRARAMSEADVVLTLGRALDYQLGYGSAAVFPRAGFARVGRYRSELREGRPGDVEIQGSVEEVLERLMEAAGSRAPATDHAWVSELRAMDRERRSRIEREFSTAPPGPEGAMHPYRLLGCVREKLQPDAIVVADGGDILSFSRVVFSAWTYLDSGAFGCLGVGIPFGIAASLQFADRQVVVITGDGALGYNLIELETCLRQKARVVFVVANNAAWNLERMDQKVYFGGRTVGSELSACDYAAMARSLGMHAERVSAPTELPEAVNRAFRSAPALLDVIVTREALSPDFVSGLTRVPDFQALEKWDKMERKNRGQKEENRDRKSEVGGQEKKM